VPKLLTRVDVGEMDFHHRYIARSNRIAQRNARVRVAGGVEHHHFCNGILNPCHQFAFIVALAKLNLGAPFGLLVHRALNFRQRGCAIDVRLPLAKKVQVGTIEEEYLHRTKANGSARTSQLQFQQTCFKREQFSYIGVQRALRLFHNPQIFLCLMRRKSCGHRLRL